jgi:hypothetical protein
MSLENNASILNHMELFFQGGLTLTISISTGSDDGATEYLQEVLEYT